MISEDRQWLPIQRFTVSAETMDEVWELAEREAMERAYIAGKHFEFDLHLVAERTVAQARGES
jgi:hypothetical protein